MTRHKSKAAIRRGRLRNLRKARAARKKGKRRTPTGSKSIRKAIRDLRRASNTAKALLRRLK